MRKNPAAVSILLTAILIMPILYVPAKCSSSIMVGAYYYVWYEEGNHTRHWNPLDDPSHTVIDNPLLGYYNSQNESLIKQHLDWMKDAGLDFLIISWWGPNSYEDNSTKKVFETVNNYADWMKLAIMVEGFNETYGPQGYNFQAIYDYLFDVYIYPYNETYVRINERPLVCWFNFENMTTALQSNRDAIRGNPRVEARIVGHSDYCDWLFGTPWSGSPDEKPTVYTDYEICVEPRYDDTHLGQGNHSYDPSLSEGLYDEEWKEVLNYTKQGLVKLVTIYSWNEFHERSQIEPHITNDKYILLILTKTRSYIDQIKSEDQQSATNPLPYVILGIVIGMILSWLYLRYRGRESYIKEKTSPKPPPKEETEEGQQEESSAENTLRDDEATS